MRIDPGTRLGPYEILDALGAGGMGEVYRARDLRLGREVAVKLLSSSLAQDAENLQRFEREARVLASLNHPNIAVLHGLEHWGGERFLVMELVEGEPLASLLTRGVLGLDRALGLAGQIASALEAAHSRGVIHRDLKPSNVMVGPRGQAKLIDFGLSKLVLAGSREDDATFDGGAYLATRTGVVMGTIPYMSPEQASGKPVDARTDVWSFGCLLYTMLTGTPPFRGESFAETCVAILGKEPDWSRLPPETPGAIRKLLRRCLEKDPYHRLQSVGDARIELEDRDSIMPSAREAERPPRPVWMSVLRWGLAALLSLVLGVRWIGDRGGGAAAIRDIGLPHDAPMQLETYRNFAVAPDGSFVLYEAALGATKQIWYRSLTGQEARPLQGTEGAFGTPRISPDGTRVAFASGRELKVARIEGGPVVTVAEVQDPSGGAWLESGLVFFSDDDGRHLRWVDSATGPSRRVDVRYCLNPHLVGSGARVLCGGGTTKAASALDLDNPVQRRYLRSAAGSRRGGLSGIRGSDFRVVDEDYLVYMSIDGALMGTRIEDHASLTVGRSVSLVPSVRREAYSGAGQYDLTRDGSLVYVSGLNADVGRLVRLGRDGRVEPLAVEAAAHLRFAVSPDGRRLATVSERVEGHQLRVFALESEVVHTLDEAYMIGQPRWSPDGGHLVYQRWENESEESLVRLSLTAVAGPEVLLGGSPELQLWPASYPSKDLLLLGSGLRGRGAMVMDPTTDPPKVDPVGLDSLFVSLSPDRRWLAYQNPGGLAGIQIQPWPERDRRYVVDQRGQDPRWISDTELAYWTADSGIAGSRSAGVAFYRVKIDRSAESIVGNRELLLTDPLFADTPGQSFDVTPDGGLIYLRSPSQNLAQYIRVVPGWAEEMKRAVDAANPGGGRR